MGIPLWETRHGKKGEGVIGWQFCEEAQTSQHREIKPKPDQSKILLPAP